MVNRFLTGVFVRTIDEKRRIALPKRLRDALFGDNQSTIYLAPGTDQSLAIYTEESFADLFKQLSHNSPTSQDVRAFSRLFFSRAERVNLDGQGRFRISPELAEIAELTSESVLIGVGNHIEIWDRLRWESYQAEKQLQYNEIAERAFNQK